MTRKNIRLSQRSGKMGVQIQHQVNCSSRSECCMNDGIRENLLFIKENEIPVNKANKQDVFKRLNIISHLLFLCSHYIKEELK